MANHASGASVGDVPAIDESRVTPRKPVPTGFAEAGEAFVGSSHGGLPPLLDAQVGRISRIVMAIPRRAALHRARPLQRLLNALPHRAAIDILVAPEATDTVSNWIDQTGPGALACLVQARQGLGFPLWVQDLLMGRGDGVVSTIGDTTNAGLAEAARTLAAGAELRAAQYTINASGGNFLACGNRLLIGADALRDSGMELDALAAAVDPWRKPLLLGAAKPLPVEHTRTTETPDGGWTETIHWRNAEGQRQPMPRLDMLVAPAGQDSQKRARFLVGCPRRGAAALGMECPDHAMAEAFDQVAAQLAREGADVVRNPMPLVWKDDPARRRRTWFHVPANNVIVEDMGEAGRTVLLPCFADRSWPELAEVDSMNAAIWAWLGYSVIRIPGMRALAEGLGGPRRVIQIISRD